MYKSLIALSMGMSIALLVACGEDKPVPEQVVFLPPPSVGIMLGSMAGSEVGGLVDKADEQYTENAAALAYKSPVGQAIQWNNPQNGHYGTITPKRIGRDTGTGQNCVEYLQVVVVNGKSQNTNGTACQQPDGKGQVANGL